MPCSSSDPLTFPVTFLIVAGGSGLRMESAIPKQFLLLSGRPLLMRTLSAFASFCPPGDILLILPGSRMEYWQALCHEYSFLLPHRVVAGGDTRFASVKNGLSQVTHDGLVAIHDGVRPLVSGELTGCLLDKAAKEGNAIPVLPLSESIRYYDNRESRPVMRENLFVVQTPQVFRVAGIRKAYGQSYRPDFTDDASVYESAGGHLHLTEGDPVNLKITTPADLRMAASLLESV